MTLFKRLQSKRPPIWQPRLTGPEPKPLPPNGHDALKALEWWMHLIALILGVCVVLLLSGCSGTLSTQPTVPRIPPEACLRKCPELPKPADGKDLTIRLWEYEVIDLYGKCRRDKATCTDWLMQ